MKAIPILIILAVLTACESRGSTDEGKQVEAKTPGPMIIEEETHFSNGQIHIVVEDAQYDFDGFHFEYVAYDSSVIENEYAEFPPQLNIKQEYIEVPKHTNCLILIQAEDRTGWVGNTVELDLKEG